MKRRQVLYLIAIFAFGLTVFAANRTPITDIPAGGLTINAAGTYYFANDIQWVGQNGVRAAITITAPDVTLKMNGHTLTGPRDVDNSGTIGISADGADNLSLEKGTIKGFQSTGIGLANSYGVTLNRIKIENVGNGVPGHTPTGLSASKCQQLTLKRIKVSNVNGSWFGSNSYGQIVSGISLSECSNVNISGDINGINGFANIVSGIFGVLCNTVTLNRVKVDDVNGSAVAVSGVSFGLSTNITINRSSVEDLHNDAGVCSGIATDDCQTIKVLGTKVKDLSTGLMSNTNAVGHTCIGMVFAPIRVIDGVNKINVTNAGNNYSQILLPAVQIDPPPGVGSPAVGFPIIDSDGKLEKVLILKPGSGYAVAPNVAIISNPLWPAGTGATATAEVSALEEGSASDILVDRCRISNIKGSCDDAHGISLFVVSNATVRRVTVDNVQDGRGGRGAKATGIEVYGLISNQPSNILIDRCRVQNIMAISPGDLQATGFSIAGKGVTISRCRSTNVSVSGVNPIDPTSPGYGIGFGWAPDIRSEYTYAALEAKIENCIASKCQVGYDTFYFKDSTFTKNRSVRNDVDIKQEAAGVIRTFYCDKCSESPTAPQAAPDNWYTEVPVTNIATGNTFE